MDVEDSLEVFFDSYYSWWPDWRYLKRCSG